VQRLVLEFLADEPGIDQLIAQVFGQLIEPNPVEKHFETQGNSPLTDSARDIKQREAGMTVLRAARLTNCAVAEDDTATALGVVDDEGREAELSACHRSGQRSLVSLSELDPRFSGTTNPELVTFSGNTASLVFTAPGASGRNLTDLTNLQLLSVPSLPLTSAQQSTTVVPQRQRYSFRRLYIPGQRPAEFCAAYRNG
jgi:hypothetical protein